MSNHDQSETGQATPRKPVGEWFWRFLAVVMFVSVGWIVWISYQLNPPLIATNAAFEAAAMARLARPAETVAAKPEAPAAAPAPQAVATPQLPSQAPKEPPVNLEKLKLSDSIAIPVAEPTKAK